MHTVPSMYQLQPDRKYTVPPIRAVSEEVLPGPDKLKSAAEEN